MKEILEINGFSESQTGSPRQIIKTAYKAGMLKDEESWLLALAARNNVAHSYNKVIALDIIRNTKDKFYDMFMNLKQVLEENWIE